MIPDLFLFCRDRPSLVCFEVEDSSPLSEHKAGRYVDLWWLLDDGMNWWLEVVLVDRNGGARHVDMFDLVYRDLRRLPLTELPMEPDLYDIHREAIGQSRWLTAQIGTVEEWNARRQLHLLPQEPPALPVATTGHLVAAVLSGEIEPSPAQPAPEAP